METRVIFLVLEEGEEMVITSFKEAYTTFDFIQAFACIPYKVRMVCFDDIETEGTFSKQNLRLLFDRLTKCLENEEDKALYSAIFELFWRWVE